MLKPYHQMMKKGFALALMLALAACASSGGDSNKKVEVQIQQLNVTTSTQPVGPFQVQYGIAVKNLTTEPITIKRVSIRQIGSGSYSLSPLNPPSFNFAKVIAPGATDGVSVSMHAYLLVPASDMLRSEPVTVRAVVDFDSPSGVFHKMVNRLMSQYGE
jgi:hypothetical protein